VAALREAARDNDLILTSGGVSVGEEDHIKPAVQQLGSLDLWQIAMKPGKPFACGKVADAHFIGLPGNPVSSFVTFVLLVRPFLLKLQGATRLAPAALQLAANFDWPRPDKRREFLRARRDAQGRLELFPNQSSGVLTSTVWADGLVDVPAGQTIARGDAVRFLPLVELLA
jgi:molybdopterin molybdotransferase